MNLAIIAGGKGTRLGRTDLPKPMVPIYGKPILEYQIDLASRYGITDIYVLSGFMAHVIEDYFMDGSRWGVKIHHIVEKEALGTAGAIKQLESIVKDRFMVFYGDTVMDINLKKMIDFDQQYQSIGTILVHPNDHPYDSDLIDIDDSSNRVQKFFYKYDNELSKPNLVNAALYILSEKIFNFIPSSRYCDFGKDIFPIIISNGQSLYAYRSAEYIKDMGTLDRFLKIETDLKNGKVNRLNNEYKRKAIFLDRDGVLNKEVNNLKELSEFELYDGVTEAINKINHSDFLSIIITNQPVIAKGMCTLQKLKEIHNKMEGLLGQDGAYLDGIYFCPHHPDAGYKNEVKELKIVCSCRKPNIGLIEKAANEYNIDLPNSYFIGDTTTDIQTGINAGLQTILVRTGYGGTDKKISAVPTYESENVLTAVNQIFSLESSVSTMQCVENIIDLLQQDSTQKIFVAVGGLSRSGKSTLIGFMKHKLGNCVIGTETIELDNWILPVENRSLEMTVRDRFQYNTITKDLMSLISFGEIEIHPYDYQTRSLALIKKRISIKDSQVVFLDGVIALDHPLINEMAQFKIYVEIDEAIRKQRFISFYKHKELNSVEIEDLYLKRMNEEVSIVIISKENADKVVIL